MPALRVRLLRRLNGFSRRPDICEPAISRERSPAAGRCLISKRLAGFGVERIEWLQMHVGAPAIYGVARPLAPSRVY